MDGTDRRLIQAAPHPACRPPSPRERGEGTSGSLRALPFHIKSYKKIDEELFDDLEEVLITSDVGINTTMELIDNLRDRIKKDKVFEPEEVKDLLKDEIKKIMEVSILDNKLNIEPSPA
ncbi:MAG TPA: signal recognition particle receptor subunit alpha, partial [Mycoplana sp.]|nr:signal recognition particle receptor subunit alpha [Mycoplana sp.]